MILNSIGSRKAVIKGKIVFYIHIDLEKDGGFNTRNRVTMDIEKGADVKTELYEKLKSLTNRVLDA